MLGETLKDPFSKESSITNLEQINGIGLLPLKTTFLKKKITRQINSESLWPCKSVIQGFEIHNGVTELNTTYNTQEIKPIFKDIDLGLHRKK